MTETVDGVAIEISDPLEFDWVLLRALTRANARKEVDQQKARKEERAWSVDEDKSDGAWLLSIVRELNAERIVNQRRPPRRQIDVSLLIRICPHSYEDEAAGPTFVIPAGAVLTKHSNGAEKSYMLDVPGGGLICFTYTRMGRLKLGRHPGFRKDRQHAVCHPNAGAMMRPVLAMQ